MLVSNWGTTPFPVRRGGIGRGRSFPLGPAHKHNPSVFLYRLGCTFPRLSPVTRASPTQVPFACLSFTHYSLHTCWGWPTLAATSLCLVSASVRQVRTRIKPLYSHRPHHWGFIRGSSEQRKTSTLSLAVEALGYWGPCQQEGPPPQLSLAAAPEARAWGAPAPHSLPVGGTGAQNGLKRPLVWAEATRGRFWTRGEMEMLPLFVPGLGTCVLRAGGRGLCCPSLSCQGWGCFSEAVLCVSRVPAPKCSALRSSACGPDVLSPQGFRIGLTCLLPNLKGHQWTPWDLGVPHTALHPGPGC